MEPGNWNSPRQSAAQGSWSGPADPPFEYSSQEPARGSVVGQNRGRTGLLALTAFVVELVIIAAACNQAVYRHELRYSTDHPVSFLGRAVGSLTVFGWRVSPRHGDNHGGVHMLWSQLVTIGVFFVVTVLLTIALTRGVVTFARVFFAVWTSAVAAACVGAAVGSLVTKNSAAPGIDRATAAVFYSVNGSVVFIGAAIGLVVALVTAVVALSTRRSTIIAPAVAAPAESAQPPVPPPPPPYYGDGGYSRPQADRRSEGVTAAMPASRPDRPVDSPTERFSTAATERLPDTSQAEPDDGVSAAPAEPNRTTQLPRFDPRGGRTWSPPTTSSHRAVEDEGQATQAFPAPPNDEDLGQRPD